MKELNFNTDSWHYEIASKGGYSPYRNGLDICSYTRAILKSLVIGMLFGLMIALVGFVFFQVLFGLVFSLIYGTWIMTMIGEITLFFICIFAIGGLLLLIGMFILSGISYLAKKPKSEAFIINAYMSWKDKYCVQINFNDKKE